MAGFSPSTYVLLLSKMKGIASGVKSVASDPSNPNNIIFTLNDNSKIKITLSNPIVFVDKYSLLPTTGKDKYIYVCKENDVDNEKGIYIWNVADGKYECVSGSGKGINIVDNYSKLSTTLTEYEINYCLNDYIDTTSVPNVIHDKGFYLYDKTTNKWNPISVTGKIASNTTLGNVIIKKDGGIEVDNNGDIWIEGYVKTEKVDAVTGNKTTTISFNGLTVSTTETPGGDVSEDITVGGVPISSNSETDTVTGDVTTTTVIGSTTTTTTTSTDASTGDTTITTIKKDEITGEEVSVSEKKDNNGNLINSTVVNKDKDGNVTNKTTTTVDKKTNPTGDSITETTIESSSSVGITKTETTTTNDTTGSSDVKTEFTGEDSMFADKDDIDDVYNSLFNNLGW